MVYYSYDTILIVDDEEDFKETLTYKIKEFTHNIFFAGNGAEALEILQNNTIHLALIDLKMPVMDGITLLKEIKKKNIDVVTIIMTGYGDKESLKNAISLGVFDFLEKPFTGNILKNALRRSFEHINLIRTQKELLEILLYKYTEIKPEEFHGFSPAQKEETLKNLLGIVKLKLLKDPKK